MSHSNYAFTLYGRPIFLVSFAMHSLTYETRIHCDFIKWCTSNTKPNNRKGIRTHPNGTMNLNFSVKMALIRICSINDIDFCLTWRMNDELMSCWSPKIKYPQIFILQVFMCAKTILWTFSFFSMCLNVARLFAFPMLRWATLYTESTHFIQ